MLAAPGAASAEIVVGPVAIPASSRAEAPAMDTNAAGDAVAAWIEPGGVVAGSVRSGKTHRWRDVTLSSGVPVSEVSAGIDADGNATIVWSESEGSQSLIVADETRFGYWQAPYVVASEITVCGHGGQRAQCIRRSVEHPDLVVGDGGQAVLTYVFQSDLVRMMYRSGPGGTWDAPYTGTGFTGAPPGAAVGPHGDAVVAWTHTGTGEGVARAALHRASTGWTEHVLTASHSASIQGIGVDVDGNAVVAWRQGSRKRGPLKNGSLFSSTARAGGTSFADPQRITPQQEPIGSLTAANRGALAFEPDGSELMLYLGGMRLPDHPRTTVTGVIEQRRPNATASWEPPVRVLSEPLVPRFVTAAGGRVLAALATTSTGTGAWTTAIGEEGLPLMTARLPLTQVLALSPFEAGERAFALGVGESGLAEVRFRP